MTKNEFVMRIEQVMAEVNKLANAALKGFDAEQTIIEFVDEEPQPAEAQPAEAQPVVEKPKRKVTSKTRERAKIDRLGALREMWMMIHLESMPLEKINLSSIQRKYHIGAMTRRQVRSVVEGNEWPNETHLDIFI